MKSRYLPLVLLVIVILLVCLYGIFQVRENRQKMKKHRLAWEHIKNAERLEGDFEYPEALKELEKAESLDPSFTRIYTLRGEIFRQVGRGSDAVEAYRKALEIEPKNSDIYHDLGFAYQWKSEPEKAVECYKKALELNPDNLPAHRELADAYLVLMSREPVDSKKWNELWDKAYNEARATLELNPDEWPGYYLMGQLYFAKQEDDRALKEFTTRVKEAGPQHYEYLMKACAHQAFIYYDWGEYDKSLEKFDEYIRMWHEQPGIHVDCLLPDRELYAFYRENLLGKKFTKEMLDYFASTDQKYLSHGVVMPVITLELRRFFREYIEARDKKDMDAMEKILRKQFGRSFNRYAYCSGVTLMGVPELQAHVAYLLGGILEKKGKHAEAVDIYKKGLEICPGHPLLEKKLGIPSEKNFGN
ncbi:MAG: tetratricopeptide repeat protein [Candidatus Eremiobacteraeota bacterium]|nr:tetratricopeptide repeat protein [Candidatus Eremiobacteraeota bacterium]